MAIQEADETTHKEPNFTSNLRQAIEEMVDAETRERILAGSEGVGRYSKPETRTPWIREVIDRLDSILDKDLRIRIREQCACGPAPSRLARVRALRRQHSDLDEFLAALQASGVVGRKAERQGDTICVSYGYGRCLCSSLRGVTGPVSVTYCRSAAKVTSRLPWKRLWSGRCERTWSRAVSPARAIARLGR